MQFRIDEESAGDIRIIRPSGFLDAHTAVELQSAVDALFAKDDYQIIFDLSELKYITSAGAGILIAAQHEARKNDGNVVLSNLMEGVRDIFDLLGLTPLFLIVDDRNAALAQFQKTAC